MKCFRWKMLPEEMVTQYDILVYEINHCISFDGFTHFVVRFSVPLMQGFRKPAIFLVLRTHRGEIRYGHRTGF